MATASMTRAAIEIAEQKIHPIVEFFPTDGDVQRDKDFIDTAQEDRKRLRTALRATKGIYAFYNSEYEIIYLGKTKKDLWTEMKNAYCREMEHYKRYRVNHPRQRYTPGVEGRPRPIRNMKAHVYDCASYFSAYAIDEDALIDLIELMMIRLSPNDLLNVRMEGNTALKPYMPSNRAKTKSA